MIFINVITGFRASVFSNPLNMEYRIVDAKHRRLIGMRLEMSLVENKTAALWGSFMPRRKEVNNRVSDTYISMQVYKSGSNPFDPTTVFEKWAVVEVTDFETVPAGMETFELIAGQYAVFDYEGPARGAPQVFQYIYGEWLPASGYTSANRPQFEILPEGYDPNDPRAREEIWIPVDGGDV